CSEQYGLVLTAVEILDWNYVR
ncbi:hypothetical protein A2U01_0034723, partial [Trifolium medium]|nr:hypothetical protein [Trifolium medium]